MRAKFIVFFFAIFVCLRFYLETRCRRLASVFEHDGSRVAWAARRARPDADVKKLRGVFTAAPPTLIILVYTIANILAVLGYDRRPSALIEVSSDSAAVYAIPAYKMSPHAFDAIHG